MPSETSTETTVKTTAETTPQAMALTTEHSASDALPDRLSIDPTSPHFNERALSRDIGVRFKGGERSDVEEYCVSEGWIKVAAGRATDRRGKPLLIKLKGPVEPYFKLPSAS